MPSAVILGKDVCSCLVYIFFVSVSQHHIRMAKERSRYWFIRDYPALVNVLGGGEISNMLTWWRQQNPSALLYMISCDRTSWSLLASLSSQKHTLSHGSATNDYQSVSASISSSSIRHVMKSGTLSSPN